MNGMRSSWLLEIMLKGRWQPWSGWWNDCWFEHGHTRTSPAASSANSFSSVHVLDQVPVNAWVLLVVHGK